MYDKHYSGEGFRFSRSSYVVNSVSLRLSYDDLKILDLYFPNKSRSFQIRSIINDYHRLKQKCNT